MQLKTVRDYSKRGDAIAIPDLVQVQKAAYERFLQMDLPFDGRDPSEGLEALLREVFPIVSYDGNMQLEYLHYKLDEPRYTPDECRELRLTYGMPFRVGVRLVRKDVPEIPQEEIYLGEIPVLMGGGEFVINGAERVIVNQLHRSPGVDFSIASAEADRPLHSARIIPERGSWIELEVSKKDVLQMRIDQSTKIPATTFMRALDEDFSSTEKLLKLFYEVETIDVKDLKPEHYAAAPIVDTDSGEELVSIGHQFGTHTDKVIASSLKKLSVISNPGDMLILNTIADERSSHVEGMQVTEHEAALLHLYARLRPGNPPQVEKARALFAEKFFDENRYRLGKVGRFRINRKFDFSDTLSYEEYFNTLSIKYVPLTGVEDAADIKATLDFVERTLVREYEPRFNSSKAEAGQETAAAKQLLATCRSAIRDGSGWTCGLENAPDGFGIYLVRDGQELVYVGQAKDRQDGGFKGRMRSHFRQKDDSLRKPIAEWLTSNSRVQMRLTAQDFFAVIGYILDLRNNRNKAHIDDIDHLGNRRLRTLDELAVEDMRKGFLKLKRTVQERMSVKDPDELAKIADLINSKSISSAIDHFFGRGELSQVVDQTNPLSMLTHERRLSALGPGGLNRKRAGFEVRDVHISHYGRICPIETPEGTNIGLIASLGLFSRIDEYGFLQTPYRKVANGQIGDIEYLRADEEMKLTLGPTDTIDEKGKLKKGAVLARVDGDLAQVGSDELDYVDVSPKQIVGVSAALIPFLEHDDANRALMGSNMQRQAVPLIKTEPPAVGTGMEKDIPKYSGMVVRATRGGVVTYVDAERIIIDNADEYVLRKFVGLNERTCQNQKPIINLGQKVKAGEIIADGAATNRGELALGKNVLVAFNTFDGYNFEDAIVISERLVKDDVFTSIHIEEFDVEIRETKLGREEFTADIPNVSEKMLSMLDEFGIIRTGAYVKPGDILVGKVSPKSKSELTPEEKLLHAIFGRAGEDVKNDSLEVPAGTEGIVIGAKRFSRRMHLSEDQKKQLKREMREYEASMDTRAADLFRQMVEQVNEVTGTAMVDPSTRQKVGASDITEVVLEQIETFDPKWIKGSKETREQAMTVYNAFWPRIEAIEKEKQRKLAHMKRGDELPSGVLEMVKVYIATKRALSVGDKMAGRHGNKGVISRIVPEADMPFLEDGTPVDVLLNPLGVGKRMNLGQILETHLGWACAVLGFQAVTPVFDGALEEEIRLAIEEANEYVDKRMTDLAAAGEAPNDKELLVKMPPGFKVQLHDGRTGEPFDQKTTVGYMYLLKLHHLVDDKIHARATGPYSLITQQPLGGKARTGGQRFGEMEVWALEAYGAAYILQELLTVKSDDVEGRTKIYESMVKGTNTLEAGMPVAFDVLCNEIKGLGLNITLEKAELDGGSIL